jgi:hypothetical protein
MVAVVKGKDGRETTLLLPEFHMAASADAYDSNVCLYHQIQPAHNTDLGSSLFHSPKSAGTLELFCQVYSSLNQQVRNRNRNKLSKSSRTHLMELILSHSSHFQHILVLCFTLNQQVRTETETNFLKARRRK